MKHVVPQVLVLSERRLPHAAQHGVQLGAGPHSRAAHDRQARGVRSARERRHHQG